MGFFMDNCMFANPRGRIPTLLHHIGLVPGAHFTLSHWQPIEACISAGQHFSITGDDSARLLFAMCIFCCYV